MTPDPAVQLVIGLLAFPLWSGVLLRHAHVPPQVLGAGVVVAVTSWIVICIFGSLRLMGVLSDELWAVTGTGLRTVVDLCAVVCLVSSARE